MFKKKIATFLRKLADTLDRKKTLRIKKEKPKYIEHSFLFALIVFFAIFLSIVYGNFAGGFVNLVIAASFIIYSKKLSIKSKEKAVISIITFLLCCIIFAFMEVKLSLFMVPLSGFAVVIGILIGQYFSNVYSIIFSIYIASFSKFDFSLFLFHLLSSNLSVLFISTSPHTRLKTVLIGFVSIFLIPVVYPVFYIESKVHDFTIPIYMSISAVLSSFIANFFTIFFEHSFNFLTDMRLLELMDTTKGILNRLAIEAPGTYHHLHEVSKIAGEVAKKLNADVLLTKCGALYHDIGKILKPEIFIENIEGDSSHKYMTPSLSALAIMSHVKDGERLALEEGLPEEIISFILSHHGTTKVEYFYALEDDKNASIVYTYPGPKPKTIEEAIVMLADSIEAAVRALKTKSDENIANTVEKIINKRVFEEEQLSETPLTIKDIETLKTEFIRVMLDHYHKRIEYVYEE
ncbi:MAG: HDIG domain-containing protein [bacterium]|nr:HDIG domain-containing protein [bacterium]